MATRQGWPPTYWRVRVRRGTSGHGDLRVDLKGGHPPSGCDKHGGVLFNCAMCARRGEEKELLGEEMRMKSIPGRRSREEEGGHVSVCGVRSCWRPGRQPAACEAFVFVACWSSPAQQGRSLGVLRRARGELAVPPCFGTPRVALPSGDRRKRRGLCASTAGVGSSTFGQKRLIGVPTTGGARHHPCWLEERCLAIR